MKADFYTKAVLTIIAVCLVIIVLKHVNIFPDAYAISPESGMTGSINYGLVPLNADGSIDVNIKSSTAPMDVDIADISTYDKLKVDITDDLLNVDITDISTSDRLKVYIDEVNGLAFSVCTVPVKINPSH